jgi:hypothetical protein
MYYRNPLSSGKRNFINQMLQRVGISGEKADTIIELAFDADPTDNGNYTPWVVTQVLSENIQLPEDTEDIAKLLMVYNRIKPFLPAQEDGINLKNINEYLSPKRLKEIVEKYADLRAKRGGAKEDAIKGQRIVLEQGPYTVIEALTPHAAAKLTREGDANWCVSNIETAREYLDDGPLYFIDKNGQRFVLAHCKGTYCAEFESRVAHKEEYLARYEDKKCPICGKQNSPKSYEENYKWVICPGHSRLWSEIVAEYSETCDEGPIKCEIKNIRNRNLSAALKEEIMPVLRALFSPKAASSLEHITDYLYNFGVKGEDAALKKQILESQNPKKLVDYVIARHLATKPRRRWRRRRRRRGRRVEKLKKPDIGKAKPWVQAEKFIFQDPVQASRYFINVYSKLTASKKKILSNKLKKLWSKAERLAIPDKVLPTIPDMWVDPIIYADAEAADKAKEYLSGEDDGRAARAKEAARQKLIGLEDEVKELKESYEELQRRIKKERQVVDKKYETIKARQRARGVQRLDKISKVRTKRIVETRKTNKKLERAAQRAIISIRKNHDLRSVILTYLKNSEGRRNSWSLKPYQGAIKEFFFEILRYYDPVSYANNFFEKHYELRNQTRESLWKFYQDNARLLRSRKRDADKAAKEKAQEEEERNLRLQLRMAKKELAKLHETYDFD